MLRLSVNDKKQLLIEAILAELFTSLRGASPAAIASALADRVIEEGWQWHPTSTEAKVKEEWRVVLADDDIIDIDPNDVSLFGNKGMKWGVQLPKEEEWRVIPDLPTRAYEVNKTGDIRIAHTKKVLPLEGYDIDFNMEVVEVRINGASFMLNGPLIARELFN